MRNTVLMVMCCVAVEGTGTVRKVSKRCRNNSRPEEFQSVFEYAK